MKKNIFVSDCGNFVAIRIPGPVSYTFDVWREDGSEMWTGNRWVKAPGTSGYNTQSLYMEEHAKNTKIVGSWTNLGHEKRDGAWVEAFELSLVDLTIKESFSIEFHTSIGSLASQYKKRRRNDKGR